MAEKYRVAVIGRTGKGAYGHGLDVVWKEIDNAEVVAVADPDEKGRALAAKRLGVKNAYADYREMLEKEKPRVVSVADRFLDQHRDMVVACARAGASIFLEKPMCRTLAEADEMVKAVQMHHVKLAIAHQTRYSPRIARLRELIAAGMLGEILEIRGRGKEDRRGGGEDLMVLGTHIFDLMRFLVGDASWCFANVMAGGKPATRADVRTGGEGMGAIVGDRLYATYGFEKGMVGSFGSHVAKHGVGSRFALTLYGSKGMAVMNTGSLPPVWICEDPTWVGRAKPWVEVSSAGLGKPEPLKNGGLGQGNVWIVKDLLESIEKDREPLGGISDGRAALEMIHAVYASHRAGVPVKLPLKERGNPLEGW
ncbi:MAG: gfo/Idh/MocA family oxidoreductase [Planctomycetia bacterium]|nr:gfo/Idh/MocA family oxidoreductase [Planctomycetia bacterium]